MIIVVASPFITAQYRFSFLFFKKNTSPEWPFWQIRPSETEYSGLAHFSLYLTWNLSGLSENYLFKKK